jgi:ComF family protein
MARAAAFVKTALAPLRQARLSLLDQLYPPVCLACDAPVAAPDTLCAHCFHYLRPITAPFCQRLGIPLAAAMGAEALSAEAIADPPPFERARAAVVYGDLASLLVSRLKYGDRPEMARFCARLMAAAGRELWAEKPILVPVPLHRRRLMARRYNQSTELARLLARETGLSLVTDLVRRTRPTRRQVGLSGDQRRRNVAGAFTVTPQAIRHAGKRIVIVDDVLTTGSTAKALTQALKRAGFIHIDVITFARVVIGDDLPI